MCFWVALVDGKEIDKEILQMDNLMALCARFHLIKLSANSGNVMKCDLSGKEVGILDWEDVDAVM